MELKPTVFKKKLKIVAVSDTHGQYYTIKRLLQQKGDIFICAGDFTYYGMDQDFDKFIDFLDSLKGFKHKIVISGNHQIVLDDSLQYRQRIAYYNEFPCKYNRQFIISQIKKRAIYLEHQYVQVQGLKIFGSPYTSFYCGSAFQVKKQPIKMLWSKIPQNLDILITHGPPFSILDRTARKINAGCPQLLERVKQVKPKIHLFGHIHQGRAGFGQCSYVKAFGTRFYNVAQRPEYIEFEQ